MRSLWRGPGIWYPVTIWKTPLNINISRDSVEHLIINWLGGFVLLTLETSHILVRYAVYWKVESENYESKHTSTYEYTKAWMNSYKLASAELIPNNAGELKLFATDIAFESRSFSCTSCAVFQVRHLALQRAKDQFSSALEFGSTASIWMPTLLSHHVCWHNVINAVLGKVNCSKLP